MMSINLLAQNDVRWSSKIMEGEGSDTIGRWGCFLTCVTMLLQNFNIRYTPDDLADEFSKRKWFTPDGLNLYNIHEQFPKVHCKGRNVTTLSKERGGIRYEVDSAVARIKQLIKMGQAVPIFVDSKRDGDNLPEHWVLAVDITGDDLVVFDPWNGRQGTLNDGTYDGPFAWYEIIGSPINFPDCSTDADKKLIQVTNELYRLEHLPAVLSNGSILATVKQIKDLVI